MRVTRRQLKRLIRETLEEMSSQSGSGHRAGGGNLRGSLKRYFREDDLDAMGYHESEEEEDDRSMGEVLPISTEEYHRMLYGGNPAELKRYLGGLAWDVAYGDVVMPDRDVDRIAKLSRHFNNTLDSAHLQWGVDTEGY